MTSMIRLLPAAPLCAMLLASAAQAETRASAVVSAEGGYGSNPFLSAASTEKSAGSLILSAAPTITFEGPTSNLDLTGTVEQTFYTSRYGDTTSWSLGANAAAKISPFTDLSLRAGYSSYVNSGQSSIVGEVPATPENPVPVIDPSAVDLFGQRSKTFSASAGITSRLSARDSVDFSANVVKVDYPVGLNSSYTSYGSSAGMNHQFNARVSGGFGVDYSKTDYDQASFGKFESISPNLRLGISLSQRTRLDMSAGASFSKTSGVPGAGGTRAYFSGRATLCNQGLRSNLCLSGSRSVGATAGGGSSTITAIGGNYSYTLTPRSSVQVGANYTATKSIDTFIAGYESSYISTFSRYSLQLTERISFTANARYTDPIKSIGSRRKNFYGGVGVSYRLGR